MNGKETQKTLYHWYYMDGYLKAADKPPALREAYARYELYSKAPVFIYPGELIAGNLDRALEGEAVLNRISAHYIHNTAVEGIRASDDFSREEKEIFEYKLEKMREHILYEKVDKILTEDEKLAKESGMADSCHFNGHMVLDYEYLLDRGLGGIKADIEAYRSGDITKEQETFYEALDITVDAMSLYMIRHAKRAAELIEAGSLGYDQDILKKVRDNCLNISNSRPENFLEALQLICFMMGFADYDSFGRFDQYMYPSFKADLETSELDINTAKIYLKHLWNKIEQNGSIINMTIGGCHPDGRNAVNDLTYLVMDVTRELKYKGPNLCLRIDKNSTNRLWSAIYQSLSAGQALPALYNDDVIIPMLMEINIAKRDAYDYALAGCSQVVIPAKSSFACDMGAYNALKCLELALHDGYDRRIARQTGPRTGDPIGFTDFKKLYEAYLAQTYHAVKTGVSINNKDHLIRKDDCSCIRSMLTRDCLKKGRGIFRKGAVYYGVQNEVIGLTNTANALYAIKKLVYEKRSVSLKKLIEALDNDFEGCEDLRQTLILKAEKFGNDEPDVDNIRGEITRDFFEKLGTYKAELGGFHYAGEVIFHYHVAYGYKTLASADGRKAYSPLADSAGPAQGTDKKGPTAVLNSMLRIPMHLERTCCSLNLMFSKMLWESGREQMIALFRSYFKRGGYQLQINVTDKETLIKAKADPENYSTLVVRVGGYSAYFTSLAPDIQDDIIRRTENNI